MVHKVLLQLAFRGEIASQFCSERLTLMLWELLFSVPTNDELFEKEETFLFNYLNNMSKLPCPPFFFFCKDGFKISKPQSDLHIRGLSEGGQFSFYGSECMSSSVAFQHHLFEVLPAIPTFAALVLQG